MSTAAIVSLVIKVFVMLEVAISNTSSSTIARTQLHFSYNIGHARRFQVCPGYKIDNDFPTVRTTLIK